MHSPFPCLSMLLQGRWVGEEWRRIRGLGRLTAMYFSGTQNGIFLGCSLLPVRLLFEPLTSATKLIGRTCFNCPILCTFSICPTSDGSQEVRPSNYSTETSSLSQRIQVNSELMFQSSSFHVCPSIHHFPKPALHPRCIPCFVCILGQWCCRDAAMLAKEQFWALTL